MSVWPLAASRLDALTPRMNPGVCALRFLDQSQKNPDESLESFTPADGTVNYLHLGPVYKSLAPTPWVSMPKPDTGNGPVCAWGGVLPGCKVADDFTHALGDPGEARLAAALQYRTSQTCPTISASIANALTVPGGEGEALRNIWRENRWQ